MEEHLYDNMAEMERSHWWYQGRKDIIVELIATLVAPEGSPPLRILDVGAGTGLLACEMPRFGDVTALESAAPAVVHLEQRGIDVQRGGLPDTGLAGSDFDLVTAFDVLEHIEDDAAAAREMRRLVRPGGHLLITVPANPRLWSAHDEAHHHHRRYTAATLQALMDAAEVDTRFLSPFMTVLYPAFIVDRLVQQVRPPKSLALSVPPAPINGILRQAFAFERHWLRRMRSAPFGSSLVALARRPPG